MVELPPATPPASPRGAGSRGPKIHGRLAASLPRRRAKVDPSHSIRLRHANDLKRITFYSDEIDRMTAIVEERKFKLATVRHTSSKLDAELHDLSVRTNTALAGSALDKVQTKVDRTSQKLRAKLEKKNLERTQVADREDGRCKETSRPR